MNNSDFNEHDVIKAWSTMFKTVFRAPLKTYEKRYNRLKKANEVLKMNLFGDSDYLEKLSLKGDPLERLDNVVDFECFRPTLNRIFK